jgi:hypothetical protein
MRRASALMGMDSQPLAVKMYVPLSLLSIIVVKVTTTKFSNQGQEFGDIIPYLALNLATFSFLAFTKKERQTMEVVVGKKSGLDETSLKVMRQLERILIILSNILQMFNESYNHHLTLTT